MVAPANQQPRRKVPPGYEQKFAEWIEFCEEQSSESNLVVIASPHSLGDNYDEIIESLNRLADGEKKLAIVPMDKRMTFNPLDD